MIFRLEDESCRLMGQNLLERFIDMTVIEGWHRAQGVLEDKWSRDQKNPVIKHGTKMN